MSNRSTVKTLKALSTLVALLVSVSACNYTRHVKEGQYLLRANNIKLKSGQNITRKGEMKDNLGSMIVQKPNTYVLGFPYKLWLYNSRYDKYQADTNNFQLKSKTVEKPVIYDSSSKMKSALNMKSYLFNQGYFYGKVDDTTTFKGKKAFVTYKVETGTNYLINQISYDINDSTVNSFVTQATRETKLKAGVEFTYILLEEERTRITTLLRNEGYYKINNNNISFELDTLNKQYAKDKDNFVESAIDFVALQKNGKKPTLNIRIIIRADEDPSAYYRYGISKVRVFPDYAGGKDFRDSTMIQKVIGKVTIKYHDYYVNENILYKHLFIEPDKYYSQDAYDLTVAKLNELGIFQSIRISFSEDTSRGPGWLNANVFLAPSKKFDFNTNLEASSGNTYTAGSAVSLSFRNKNFGRGANLLTLTLNGGIELTHDTIGNNFFDRFHLLTRSAGANASLDFPKFLIPFTIRGMSKKNIPRTEVAAGVNLLDRVKYFTLINSSVNFRYKWRETSTKRWEFAPAFANLIQLPYKSDSFQRILDSNTFLKNSYKSTLIEGENLAFVFTDRDEHPGKDYTYIRVGGEEAGGILKGINGLTPRLDSAFSQYLKFDLDAQHFFIRPHAILAFRLQAGVGLPYGYFTALPYIKQYYVGGAYSLRGFRIRTLGPGLYIDTAQKTNNVVDRTGDVKLEMNGEYRFDLFQMFSGVFKLKSAVFVDAGNIWLAKKSSQYPGGEFNFNDFTKGIAISTGVGLRVDIAGFFLVRLDVGFPIKKPDYYITTVSRGWVVDELLSTHDWGKKNLVYNFAIGYPF